ISRLSDEPGACGRTHGCIMRVTGRDDDMMIIRGVNVYPSQVEAVLVGLPGLPPPYQSDPTRQGALDTLTVDLPISPNAPRRAAPSISRASRARCSITSSR